MPKYEVLSKVINDRIIKDILNNYNGAFAVECGWKLSPLSEKSLYTGMITASGRFRYDSTSSQTFRLASFLMEQKFSTEDNYDRYDKTESKSE